MQKTVPNAFTLLELLVVIAIMAIVGLITFANFRSFGEGQTLPNAALDLKSTLHRAQANAAASVQCGINKMKSWRVRIHKYGGVDYATSLECEGVSYPTITTKQYGWPKNIKVERVYDNGSGSCDNDLAGDYPDYSVIFKFQALLGTPTLESKVAGVTQNCSGNKFTIQIKDTKTTEIKYVTVDQGGINVN